MGRDEAVNDHDRTVRLAARTALLERRLAALGRGCRLAAARLSENTLLADFRTRRTSVRGIERDVPGVFTLEDDPSTLDLGRLGSSFAVSPTWSILNGELRVNRSVLLAESECVVILDLSRSVFSGCLGFHWGEDPDGPEWMKLTALYHAATAFLSVVAAARFSIRVVYIHDGRFTEERVGSHHGAVARTLASMSRHLMAVFRRAEHWPALVERFALGKALGVPLRRRVRNDVVIISDFLDPLAPGYFHRLAGTLARHQVLLVDIARPGVDLNVRLPRPWIDVNQVQSERREGARHLEQEVTASWTTRAAVRSWNAARSADRRRLDSLLSRWSAHRVPVFVTDKKTGYPRPLDAMECHTRAITWLQSLL